MVLEDRNDLYFRRKFRNISGRTGIEHMLKNFLYQVGSALIYLHSKKLVHRDLKPSNVLFDSKGNWKICDFGSARVIGNSMTPSVGTTEYRAPEETGNNYNCGVDVYALGLILSEITFPCLEKGRRKRFDRLKEQPSTLPAVDDFWSGYGIGCIDVIEMMTCESPEKRIPLVTIRSSP